MRAILSNINFNGSRRFANFSVCLIISSSFQRWLVLCLLFFRCSSITILATILIVFFWFSVFQVVILNSWFLSDLDSSRWWIRYCIYIYGILRAMQEWFMSFTKEIPIWLLECFDVYFSFSFGFLSLFFLFSRRTKIRFNICFHGAVVKILFVSLFVLFCFWYYKN